MRNTDKFRGCLIGGAGYTFDSFEVTKTNRKAFEKAKQFAENADSKPLAIFGGTATGKTHLLYAVQNRILQNNPNAKVYLTNAREMTKNLLLAITEDRDFYSFYSDADVLLIDDLQYVADKEKTMNEFLYLINKLTRSTKIMLTSSAICFSIKYDCRKTHCFCGDYAVIIQSYHRTEEVKPFLQFHGEEIGKLHSYINHSSSLVVLASYAGLGKTTLADQIALYETKHHNRNVLMIALEESEAGVRRKVIPEHTGVHIISPAYSFTFSTIMEIIQNVNQPDLIIIDYLQLISSESNETDEHNLILHYCHISAELHRLSRKTDTTILLLCQLSRNKAYRSDKHPVLRDLRFIGSAEQDADIVMFLYSDNYDYEKLSFQKEDGTIECDIAKNRYGEIGTVNLQYHINGLV